MKMKKVLALLLAVVLLVGCSVMGTLAYLSSQTQLAKNTFTVGDVVIWLDEEDVDESNTGIKGEDPETGKGEGDGLINPGRDLQNDYQLIPGRVLDKDPTVWVKEGSEEAYIRMLVTVSNIDALKEALPEFVADDGVFLLQNLVDWNAEVWQYAGYDEATATYEFRYDTTYTAAEDNGDDVDNYEDLEPLFTQITVPGTINNDNLAKLDGVYIEVVAHAIQAEGFNGDADAAWLAFDGQN